MKKYILVLFILLSLTSILSAQTPSFREVLDGLSRADANAPIELPDAFFKFPDTDPLGQLQRGIVLYAATGRAKECGNFDRIPALLAEAKKRLHAANAHLTSAQTQEKAQCLYYLGLIAEKREGNRSAAADYYTQSDGLKPDKTAKDAAQRVKHDVKN